MDPRQEIINIGKQLHDQGLLVRTWGNISCRLDKDRILITPSGIQYEDLTPEMIAEVNLGDLSWEGKCKPSSELLVHVACYNARSDIRFIIHTHQVFATVAGSLGVKEIRAMVDGDDVRIPCAPYALPGTRKLADNVKKTIQKYKSDNGIVMSNHGTICMGTISDEALECAMEMEEASRLFLHGYCHMDIESEFIEGFSSHINSGSIIYDKPDTPYRIKRMHEEIYAKRPDVRYIVHNKSQACKIVSRRATHMKPLLDDFAQLVGTSVRIPINHHGHDGKRIIVKKNVNAVFSLDDGAFCLGETKDDAYATALVLDKACIAQIAASRYGSANFLSYRDCLKMNRHYRNSYSKLAKR